MSSIFLWGGLTLFVAFSPVHLIPGISLAGLFMVIGLVVLILESRKQ